MKIIKRVLKFAWLPALILMGLVGGYYISIIGRPIPIPEKRLLFKGVTYYRQIRYFPHSMIAHVLVIDTKRANGFQLMVTPPDDGGKISARTTSQFLKEFNVQIAINGDGFFPWWSRSPLDYYPHVGDSVTPNGFSASYGKIYADGLQDTNPEPTLYISRKGEMEFNRPSKKIFHALSGDRMLIQGGKIIENLDPTTLQPRTAIGLSKNGRWLYIVVVDGRQPFYSNGATFLELAKILEDFGAFNAIALDGGGSSTMVMQDETGNSIILNSPIDNYIPGRERPVANHLGIFLEQ
ncbi:MAG: phosphodiester glycosidase family protein [Anaerolineales bacterium]